MKIAFDHHIFSLENYGGISRYFKELLLELDKIGIDSHIFAPIYINRYLKELKKSSLTGCFLNSIPPGTGRFLVEPINKMIENKKIKNWGPDIIHQTYYSNSVKKLKIPRIVTVYDMIHEKYNNNQNFIKNYKLKTLVNADHLICISNNTKQDLLDIYPFLSNKVDVVHLGYSNLLDRVDIFNKRNLPPFILFVGQRNGYKNFENLIIAYSKSEKLINNFSIVAFGGGYFSDNEKIRFKELGFGENKIIHISGDDSVLKSIYRSAVALVYPSKYEGFGLPPIEAMSESCPVICSNTSSIPEIVGDAAEIFNPYDIENMKNSIEKVVFSPIYSKYLIEKGLLRIKEFSWEKCAQETLNIYKKITNCQ